MALPDHSRANHGALKRCSKRMALGLLPANDNLLITTDHRPFPLRHLQPSGKTTRAGCLPCISPPALDEPDAGCVYHLLSLNQYWTLASLLAFSLESGIICAVARQDCCATFPILSI
jgi:hypothetical protein